MARTLVPVLVGPTAVGKTAVVAALARRWPLTVLSADSRQVYRGLDVGTAKPPPGLLATVPHAGLDVIEPGERYSAGQFARDAVRWLEAAPADRQPIVVGGTGFYVRALADGLFREPALDAGRRARLRRWLAGLAEPARWAVRLDPAFTGGGRQRAARALELALLTGRSLSWWQRRARDEGVLRPWYVLLTVPRAVLHQRIATRVQEMLARGLVGEVRAVLARGVAPDAPGLDGVGYREVVRHLAGELPASELADAIAGATRRYAKRQDTWFRNQLGGEETLTLDATGTSDAVADAIAARWGAVRGKGT